MQAAAASAVTAATAAMETSKKSDEQTVLGDRQSSHCWRRFAQAFVAVAVE